MPSAPANESPTCSTLVPAGGANDEVPASVGLGGLPAAAAVTGGAGIGAAVASAAGSGSDCGAAPGAASALGTGRLTGAAALGPAAAPLPPQAGPARRARTRKSAAFLNSDQEPIGDTDTPFIRAFPPGQRGGD